VDDGFDDFWMAYPNKQGKLPARRSWKHMNLAERRNAYRVAKAMTHSVEAGFRDRALCPHGSTFLNQRRWEEWFEDGKPTPTPPPGEGLPSNQPHDRTTEDNRITCCLCNHEVTADELETAVWSERRGWAHHACAANEVRTP
jgi:hypothetical protein